MGTAPQSAGPKLEVKNASAFAPGPFEGTGHNGVAPNVVEVSDMISLLGIWLVVIKALQYMEPPRAVEFQPSGSEVRAAGLLTPVSLEGVTWHVGQIQVERNARKALAYPWRLQRSSFFGIVHLYS